jgi:glutamate racemase
MMSEENIKLFQKHLEVIQEECTRLVPLVEEEVENNPTSEWVHFHCIVIENSIRLSDVILKELGKTPDDLADVLERARKKREGMKDE